MPLLCDTTCRLTRPAERDDAPVQDETRRRSSRARFLGSSRSALKLNKRSAGHSGRGKRLNHNFLFFVSSSLLSAQPNLDISPRLHLFFPGGCTTTVRRTCLSWNFTSTTPSWSRMGSLSSRLIFVSEQLALVLCLLIVLPRQSSADLQLPTHRQIWRT